MKFHLRNLSGFLLAPLSLLLAYTFARCMLGLCWWKAPLLPFAAGFLVYLIVHALFYRPVFMHVMGHELTHALWAFFFGGNVKSLQVTPQGGKVIINRSNFLIILAPYFFPLYTLMLLPVWAIAKDSFVPTIVFFLGASVAFHLVLTIYSIWLNQSDVRATGSIISFNFIFIVNLLILTTLLSLLAPAQYPFRIFWTSLGQDLVLVCVGAYEFFKNGRF